jgi:hypothetical protein
MTVPPPPGSGQNGPWDPPRGGGGWPPPAGVGGYPETAYGQGGGYAGPPYGQGAYPQLGGYPPPGGYPGAGYPPPPRTQGTNGFAIAALIFGIIGGALLGFIFGFIALSQTKRTGQNGWGMAIAGLILSAMWTIGIILLIVLAITTSATRDTGGSVTQGGDITATALQVGDCVNNLQNSTDVRSLPGVPCAQPHQGEVFAVFDLPGGSTYPGRPAVREQVQAECNSRLETYSPSAQSDTSIGLFSLYPQQESWAQGDRGVVCIATAETGTVTGSIKGK